MHAKGPALPPGFVAYACAADRAAQAKECGVSQSTLARYLRSPWGKWPVGVAEAYCRVCGFNFWDLRADAHPERLRTIRWHPIGKRLRKALVGIFRMAGQSPPTKDQIDALAAGFEQHSKA